MSINIQLLLGILAYITLMNLIGFISMGVDKRRAIKKQWRIPEKTLFLIAFLGGSLGSVLAMYCFHHKTKAKPLSYLLPLCLIIHVIIIIFIGISFYT